MHPNFKKSIKNLSNNPLLTNNSGLLNESHIGGGGDISTDRFSKIQTPISNTKSENYNFGNST